MKNQRLMSLDALRGFDMFFIMGLSGLVATLCALWPNPVTDAIAHNMEHVAWDGLTHHDTIFPLFLFLAGVSFPFSYAKQQELGYSKAKVYAKIFRRAAMLIFLGLIYNGLFRFDFENLRCASVLARIGIAWMGAALLYVNFGVKTRAWISVAILVGYALLSKYVGAPDVVDADPLSREGNLVGYIDRMFMPGRLIYDNNTFDPEGLFSTLPAIVTAMLGMFTGEFVRKDNLPSVRRTAEEGSGRQERFSVGTRKAGYMGLAALGMLAVGLVWSLVFPINKALWTSSFVLVVGSYSLAMFALFYYIIDVRGWQKWSLPLRVIGLNSITIYMAQAIFDFNGLTRYFFGGVARICGDDWRQVIMTGGYLLISWLFLWFLYRKKIFLKV